MCVSERHLYGHEVNVVNISEFTMSAYAQFSYSYPSPASQVRDKRGNRLVFVELIAYTKTAVCS